MGFVFGVCIKEHGGVRMLGLANGAAMARNASLICRRRAAK